MYARVLVFILFFAFAPLGVAAPQIQHWVLENGARVYFVESHVIPMFEISAVFDAGSARDTGAKSGLAMLSNHMLSQGAGDLGADEVAQRLEQVGAEFTNGIDRDMASVGLRSLTQKDLRGPALEVFAKVLAAPSFPEAALERERQRALIGLQQVKQSPGDIASRTLMQLVYRDHPYAGYPSGSEEGLRAIAREDLIAFHEQYYVGRNAVLAIVGDLEPAEARDIAERVVGQLPPGRAAARLPDVTAIDKPAVRRVNFPSSQSHILLGAPGVARGDKDYFPLLVGNYVLGGSGLVSRLAEEIRERNGLSYSVYSYFSPLQKRGPFTVGLQTKNAQRDQALKLTRATVAEFLKEGPTPAELDAAKKHLTGSFPLRIDSNGKIAGYLAMIGFYRLPLTYLDDFIPNVEAVTAEQIRTAFQRHIDPERMVTVIVGGAAR